MGENKYISVTEFAKLHQMDKGRVRRLILDGRIPAIKIGNQWAIQSDIEPPEDKRVKSGEYKNWRNKNNSPD